ncbi:hypothetical protein D3C84_998610 [compost metagenome]
MELLFVLAKLQHVAEHEELPTEAAQLLGQGNRRPHRGGRGVIRIVKHGQPRGCRKLLDAHACHLQRAKPRCNAFGRDVEGLAYGDGCQRIHDVMRAKKWYEQFRISR